MLSWPQSTDEFPSGGVAWCGRDVKRLITPYPAREKVDRVLARLGEDFYHDDIHRLIDENDDTEVAEESQDTTDPDSDGNHGDDEPAEHATTAIAEEGFEVLSKVLRSLNLKAYARRMLL